MQSGSFLNWHSLYQYKYRLPFNNGYHLHYPSSDQTENYNQNDAWKTMDKLLEQCKFNIYSKSLYNSRLLSDQNQVVLIYLATISFSIKFMLLSYEKKIKFSGNREDGILLLAALYFSSFYFKLEFLSKLLSKNSLLLIVVSATSHQRLTVKNKPKIPQPKAKAQTKI